MALLEVHQLTKNYARRSGWRGARQEKCVVDRVSFSVARGETLNVSPSDPIIKAQTDAYTADQQRQMLAQEQQFSAGHGPYTDQSAEIAAENASRSTARAPPAGTRG